MNKDTKKYFVLLVVIIVTVIGLQACSSGGDSSSSGTTDAANGETIFNGLCSACHGTDGKGIIGLGKDLTTSEFAAGLSDADYVDFIIEGRPASHEDNTTGVDMPPRGGNPSLSDQDLADVVSYVRTLSE